MAKRLVRLTSGLFRRLPMADESRRAGPVLVSRTIAMSRRRAAASVRAPSMECEVVCQPNEAICHRHPWTRFIRSNASPEHASKSRCDGECSGLHHSETSGHEHSHTGPRRGAMPWPPRRHSSRASTGLGIDAGRCNDGLRRCVQGRRRIHPRQRAHQPRLAELRAGLRRDALQQAAAGQHRQRQGPGPGVELRPRIQARRRGHAGGGRRRDVCVGLLERGARDRRAHWQAAVDLRPAGRPRPGLSRLLRRRQPRRGDLPGQGLCRRFRRTLDRARCRQRQAAVAAGHGDRPQPFVHHHRGADAGEATLAMFYNWYCDGFVVPGQR